MLGILIFLLTFLTLLFFRTMMKSYDLKFVDSDRFINFRVIVKFLLKETRTVIYIYIGVIGLYVILERIYKYDMLPTDIPTVRVFIEQTMLYKPSFVVWRLYMLGISLYFMFVLPYRILKYYDGIVVKHKRIDCLEIITNKILRKMNDKIKLSSRE